MVRGVLDADQVKNLHADQEIVVWTGNAGATADLIRRQASSGRGRRERSQGAGFQTRRIAADPQPVPAGSISYSSRRQSRRQLRNEPLRLRIVKNHGEHVVRIEAEALRALADRIAGPMGDDFNRALELLYCCAGRVVVTGMGKSGIIARKVAATLSSTGTPALYLHPAEALHGDLGNVVRGDVVIALSSSGETAEILQLLATIKRLAIPLITFTGDDLYSAPENSRAFHPGPGRRPLHWIARSRARPVRLASRLRRLPPPCWHWATRSPWLLSQKRGFKEEDFANLHPGGKLGKRLARAWSLMHSGDALPCVAPVRNHERSHLRNVAQGIGHDDRRRRRQADRLDQ